jgi:hypothetical protein
VEAGELNRFYLQWIADFSARILVSHKEGMNASRLKAVWPWLGETVADLEEVRELEAPVRDGATGFCPPKSQTQAGLDVNHTY